MISVKLLARQVEKFTSDNAPAILTAIGATGAVAATFLAARGAWEAQEKITTERERRHLEARAKEEGYFFTKTDKAKLVWTEFIPAAGALTITVASVICANRVSSKRAAAMVAAYSLSTKEYADYREKVLEKFNPNKERQVRDEIAQDRVNANPPPQDKIVIVGNGDVLCFDQPTGRYFQSSMEALRSLQNTLNAQAIEIGYSTLDDLYAGLHLKATPMSDELGWTTDKLLELQFSAVLTKDSQPCISINYEFTPLRHGKEKPGCSDDPPF